MLSLNPFKSPGLDTTISNMAETNIQYANTAGSMAKQISATSMSPQVLDTNLQVSKTELKIIKEFFIPEINKFKDTKNPDMQMHWQEKYFGTNRSLSYKALDELKQNLIKSINNVGPIKKTLNLSSKSQIAKESKLKAAREDTFAANFTENGKEKSLVFVGAGSTAVILGVKDSEGKIEKAIRIETNFSTDNPITEHLASGYKNLQARQAINSKSLLRLGSVDKIEDPKTKNISFVAGVQYLDPTEWSNFDTFFDPPVKRAGQEKMSNLELLGYLSQIKSVLKSTKDIYENTNASLVNTKEYLLHGMNPAVYAHPGGLKTATETIEEPLVGSIPLLYQGNSYLNANNLALDPSSPDANKKQTIAEASTRQFMAPIFSMMVGLEQKITGEWHYDAKQLNKTNNRYNNSETIIGKSAASNNKYHLASQKAQNQFKNKYDTDIDPKRAMYNFNRIMDNLPEQMQETTKNKLANLIVDLTSLKMINTQNKTTALKDPNEFRAMLRPKEESATDTAYRLNQEKERLVTPSFEEIQSRLDEIIGEIDFTAGESIDNALPTDAASMERQLTNPPSVNQV